MNPLNEEVKSTFYLKLAADSQSIEVVDSYEMTNEYKQTICLPYFKDVFKVFLLSPTSAIGPQVPLRASR